MSQFTYEGKTYDLVKINFGEITYFEQQFHLNMKDWSQFQHIFAQYLCSVRRGQMTAGEPLLTFAQGMLLEYDVFEDVPEPATAPEPAAEAPEETWPVDPTDAGTPPAGPGVSVRKRPVRSPKPRGTTS